jgi:Transcription factor WhiB
MGRAECSERSSLWAIPSAAESAWLELQAGLEQVGTVPCKESDAAAWWPDRRDLTSPATQGAIAACRRCPLQRPCAEYAIAADERFGVWGATLPPERRAATR